MSFKEKAIKGLATAGLIYAMGQGIIASQYFDCAIPGKETRMGRTKNAIANVVTGIVAQEMYKDSTINVDVEKQWFANSQITGYTSEKKISTFMELAMTYSSFEANENAKGMMIGEVDKSEFNWDVTQLSENSYKIERFGLKLDSRLDINIDNGNVYGTFVRGGLLPNWDVTGTYNKETGQINIDITGPATMGITLDGVIQEAYTINGRK